MAKSRKKGDDGNRIAAQNRKARHNYLIEGTLEAGIVLTGSEVKSLRLGRATIAEAYADERQGEMFLFNAYIPEYDSARHFTHQPRQPRKLLLHRREIARLAGAVKREGMTLVPLSIYFNRRGIAKVQLALGRGKQKADKRASIRERDWNREKARLMRAKG